MNEDALSRWLGKSLLLTTDADGEELEALAAVATRFEALDRAGVRTPWLPQELAWALFFDQSTRTRSAWAGAAARLGMHPVVADGGSTQVAHGETASETGAMLGMNAHALGVRHDRNLGEGQPFLRELKGGIDEYLAATGDRRRVPVVNLQCDVDHPTQALADWLWLRERLGDLRGKTVAVTWACSPSYAKPLSVPQGTLTLLSRMGVHLRLAHPPGYPLSEERLAVTRAQAEASGGSFTVLDEMDAAFRGADAVYPKSWGPHDLMLERLEAGGDAGALQGIEARALARNHRHADWICDEAKMALTNDALYLHCLPADLGAEVSRRVMAKASLDVARQAQKKVYVIMALLAAAKVEDLGARLDAAGR